MSDLCQKGQGADGLFYSPSLSSVKWPWPDILDVPPSPVPLEFACKYSGDQHSFAFDIEMQSSGFVFVSRSWRRGQVDIAHFELAPESWLALKQVLLRSGAENWRENYTADSPAFVSLFPEDSATSLVALWPDLEVRAGFSGESAPERWIWAEKAFECLLRKEGRGIDEIYADQIAKDL